jgi:hypothetical protein
MSHIKTRRTFIIFHLTLGIVVFIQSLSAVLKSIGIERLQHFKLILAVFASLEALAALLFLLPLTMRVAGIALLLIFGGAIIFHGLHGEFLSTLLVYAAGVAFVMAHGSAFGQDASSPVSRA